MSQTASVSRSKDASRFHAVLRAEEASIALRTAIRMSMFDRSKLPSRFTAEQFAAAFKLSPQGAAVMLPLLQTIGAYTLDDSGYAIDDTAAEELCLESDSSSAPYFLLGCPPEVSLLQQLILGTREIDTPLYSRTEFGRSVMESSTDVASTIGNALAARAKLFAPLLARHISTVLSFRAGRRKLQLTDFGAGSPYVSLACLKQVENIEAANLLDRSLALNAAQTMLAAEATPTGMQEARLRFVVANIFTEEAPRTNLAVFSNVLHDWSPADHKTLISNAARSMESGDIICLHEPLLLPPNSESIDSAKAHWMACYSLALFRLTAGEGRCYSRKEYAELLTSCGFNLLEGIFPTRDGCEAIFGIKR